MVIDGDFRASEAEKDDGIFNFYHCFKGSRIFFSIKAKDRLHLVRSCTKSHLIHIVGPVRADYFLRFSNKVDCIFFYKGNVRGCVV